MNDKAYEAPSIIELGSVAEVTLSSGANAVPDGMNTTGFTPPISI
jgi:hypothetical protein